MCLRVCVQHKWTQGNHLCVSKHCWDYGAGGSSSIIGFRWNRLITGSERLQSRSAVCLFKQRKCQTHTQHNLTFQVWFCAFPVQLGSFSHGYRFICVSGTETHRSPCPTRLEACRNPWTRRFRTGGTLKHWHLHPNDLSRQRGDVRGRGGVARWDVWQQRGQTLVSTSLDLWNKEQDLACLWSYKRADIQT